MRMRIVGNFARQRFHMFDRAWPSTGETDIHRINAHPFHQVQYFEFFLRC